MKKCLYPLIMAVLCVSVVYAGERNREAEEAWMKKAMEKETQRATDSQKHHGNIERFKDKYGWIKDKEPAQYEALMAANKKAEGAWSAVVQKCKTAKSPEELSAIKVPAYAASDEAHLAEITLKYAAAASGRKDMATKTGSAEVKTLAAKLDANERSMLEAHRQKSEAGRKLHRLELENRELNKAMRSAYEDARASSKAKEEARHRKK